MKTTWSVALALCATLAAGCGDGSVKTSDTPVPETANAAVGMAEIELELLSIKDLPTQLAARAGKVVILDMWATW